MFFRYLSWLVVNVVWNCFFLCEFMFSLVFGEFNFCLSVVLDMMNEFEDEYGEFGGELFFGCDFFVKEKKIC